MAKRVADATVCLLSALAFHEITTQSPASVWIALPKGARKPALDSPSLRIVRLSGLSLTTGIEDHQVDGVPVRVYSAAKTVADCFKFRNKIGLDIAIEALKDCLRQKGPASTKFTATPKSAGLVMSFAPIWRRCELRSRPRTMLLLIAVKVTV